MSMVTWPETVGLIVDGISTFSADSLNPIINALATRTAFLKNSLDNLNGSCGLLYTDTGFSPEVSVGTILAWDSEAKLYIPARPAFSDIVRADGSVAPAESSYVVGVLISEISSDGFGTILANGWIDGNNALISSILGDVDAPKGAYYLDADNPGRVCLGGAKDINVPTYCLSYTGDSGTLIFNPRAPEYTGHSHHKYTLSNDGWEVYSILPYRDKFTSDDPVFISMLKNSNLDNLTLTKNGAIVSANSWTVDLDNNSILTTFDVLDFDELVLHSISPLNGLDPLVHSIKVEKDNVLLTASSSNGNVELATNFEPTDTELKGTAISAIKESGVINCPVVHSISAGPGAVLSNAIDETGNAVPGSYVISSSAVCANQIDMQISNLDGVLFGTDVNKVCYVFPTNHTSSLFGSFRIPHFTGGKFEVKLNLVVRGNGDSIPGFDVYYEKIQFPEDGGSVKALTGTVTNTNAIAGTSTGNYYRTSATLGYVISDELLSCKLSMEGSAKAVQLISASIELVPEV